MIKNLNHEPICGAKVVLRDEYLEYDQSVSNSHQRLWTTDCSTKQIYISQLYYLLDHELFAQ